MLVTNIFLLSHNVSTLSKRNFIVLASFRKLCVNVLNLDRSMVLLCYTELNFVLLMLCIWTTLQFQYLVKEQRYEWSDTSKYLDFLHDCCIALKTHILVTMIFKITGGKQCPPCSYRPNGILGSFRYFFNL